MVYSSQITEYGWFVQIQSYVYTYIMYVRTYPFIIHWLWLFVVFQEILNFHYDVGHQGLDIYPCIQFRHPQCFPLSVTCTCVHMPFKMYWPRLFFVVFREIHNFNHDDVCRVTELDLSIYQVSCFMLVSATVSETNLNKEKNFANGYLTPFPGIRYLLTISTHWKSRLKVIIGISLSTHIRMYVMLAHQVHPYIHSTSVLCEMHI